MFNNWFKASANTLSVALTLAASGNGTVGPAGFEAAKQKKQKTKQKGCVVYPKYHIPFLNLWWDQDQLSRTHSMVWLDDASLSSSLLGIIVWMTAVLLIGLLCVVEEKWLKINEIC